MPPRKNKLQVTDVPETFDPISKYLNHLQTLDQLDNSVKNQLKKVHVVMKDHYDDFQEHHKAQIKKLKAEKTIVDKDGSDGEGEDGEDGEKSKKKKGPRMPSIKSMRTSIPALLTALDYAIESRAENKRINPHKKLTDGLETLKIMQDQMKELVAPKVSEYLEFLTTLKPRKGGQGAKRKSMEDDEDDVSDNIDPDAKMNLNNDNNMNVNVNDKDDNVKAPPRKKREQITSKKRKTTKRLPDDDENNEESMTVNATNEHKTNNNKRKKVGNKSKSDTSIEKEEDDPAYPPSPSASPKAPNTNNDSTFIGGDNANSVKSMNQSPLVSNDDVTLVTASAGKNVKLNELSIPKNNGGPIAVTAIPTPTLTTSSAMTMPSPVDH